MEDFRIKSGEPKKGEPKDNVGIEEQKIVAKVENLFAKAKNYRTTFDKDWIENYQFYKGKHWERKLPSYRHSEVINLTRSAIQNVIIPILTDSRPNIETLPQEPSDFEFSQVMTQLLRSKWDSEQFSRVLIDGIIDAAIYGTGIGNVEWDEDLLYGLGDYTFDMIDPFYFYPSPDAFEVNHKNTDYIIYAEPILVSKIKKKYPEKAHLIESDLSDLEASKIKRTTLDDYRYRSAVDKKTLVQGERGHDSEAPDRVLVIRCDLKDDTIIEEEKEKILENGEKGKYYEHKKKYPRGRRIIIANGVLLEDKENPYMDSLFPYARLVDNQMPREFWGDGEVQLMKGVNRMVDRVMSYVLDVLVMTGNPIWKVPLGSGVDVRNLVSKPGDVIIHNDGFEPKREAGVQLQPYILQLFNQLVEIFDKESGINDVSQGATPSANASGIAIDMLQEAARTKLRMKSRNIEFFLKDIGRLFVSRTLQYYTTPRVLRILNNDQAAKFFKFHVEERLDASGEAMPVAVLGEIEADNKGGLLEKDIREFEIKGNLDVVVNTGSTLPFAKAVKAAQARQLFELGVLDAADLLEAIEWPKKEKVLEKYNQRQQMAMQMQLAQQQGAQNAEPRVYGKSTG